MRLTGFIGPSYTLRSVNFDCQRSVNLYPEFDETGTGKEREIAMLVGTPGLRQLLTVGEGPIRGVFTASNGIIYVVSKDKLYSVDASWSPSYIGQLNTVGGQVSMADNGQQLCLVDGPCGYIYTFATAAFARITSGNFLGADKVAFQDGYFIFNKPNTGQFYITGLYDGFTIDALDFATAEGAPDNIVSLLSDHRELWLFGDRSVEVFFNSGNPDFPFERVQGAFIEHGCAAAHSVAKLDNTVFWLGQDDKGAGVVYAAQGYAPNRISTHAVEYAIQSYGDPSDAVAYTYQQDGHSFYALNFTSANTTWVFDTKTNLWHERTYTNSGQQERHRANCHAFAYNTHVVGDYQTNQLYALDMGYYSDNMQPITRLRVAPHLTQGLKRLFFNSFQLDMETGVGLDGIQQGTDPQVMLQFSDDGGHSWSNEKWVSAGKLGKTKHRALWRRLGQSRDRVFRVKVTDPVKVILMGVEVDAVGGGS